MVQRMKMLKHSKLGSLREKKIQGETEKSKQSPLVWRVVEGRTHWPEGWGSRFHFKHYILRSSGGCGTEIKLGR